MNMVRELEGWNFQENSEGSREDVLEAAGDEPVNPNLSLTIPSSALAELL